MRADKLLIEWIILKGYDWEYYSKGKQQIDLYPLGKENKRVLCLDLAKSKPIINAHSEFRDEYVDLADPDCFNKLEKIINNFICDCNSKTIISK